MDSTPFLIDTGTACYTSDYALRNHSRSTAAHNSISVDDHEQNRFLEKALFFMFRDANPKIDLWTVTDNKIIVSGKHDGYGHMGKNIVHRRTLEVSLDSRTIEISDEITGELDNSHLVKAFYLTPFSVELDKTGSAAIIAASSAQKIRLQFESDSQFHLKAVDVNYFPRYGLSKPGRQLVITSRAKLPFQLKTKIVHEGVASTENRLSTLLVRERTKRELVGR